MSHRQFPRLYIIGRRFLHRKLDAVNTSQIAASGDNGIDDQTGGFKLPHLGVDGVRIPRVRIALSGSPGTLPSPLTQIPSCWLLTLTSSPDPVRVVSPALHPTRPATARTNTTPITTNHIFFIVFLLY